MSVRLAEIYLHLGGLGLFAYSIMGTIYGSAAGEMIFRFCVSSVTLWIGVGDCPDSIEVQVFW